MTTVWLVLGATQYELILVTCEALFRISFLLQKFRNRGKNACVLEWALDREQFDEIVVILQEQLHYKDTRIIIHSNLWKKWTTEVCILDVYNKYIIIQSRLPPCWNFLFFSCLMYSQHIYFQKRRRKKNLFTAMFTWTWYSNNSCSNDTYG